MEIYLSTKTGSAYILDQETNLMFRPMSKNDDCFNLDIDAFDYVEFNQLEGETLDSSQSLPEYLREVRDKLITLRNNKPY